MIDLLSLHKQFILTHVKEGDTCADFTMGNGYDTEFLCRTVVLVAAKAMTENHDFTDILQISAVQLAADIMPLFVDLKITFHCFSSSLSSVFPQPERKMDEG